MLQPRVKYQLGREGCRHAASDASARGLCGGTGNVAGGTVSEGGFFKTVLLAAAAVALVLAALAALALSPAKAQAAVAVDVDAPASLELSLTSGGEAASGVAFSIYRVAEVAFTGELTPVSPFAGYGISFEDDTAEGWAAMAQSLNELVFADGIAPSAKALTDARGVASFSGLPVGLYLVTGEDFRTDGAGVVPAPFMICLPDLSDGDEWLYDVQAGVKSQIVPDASSGTSSGGSSSSGKPSQGKLPQTGQLWWPVPVLLLTGVAFTALGAARLRRS